MVRKILKPAFLLIFIFVSDGLRADQLTDDSRLQIMELIYSFMFENNGSSTQEKTEIYFLKFPDEKDPPEDFLQRFLKIKQDVVKGSRAVLSPKLGVYDSVTGRRGLIINIKSINYVKEDKVYVEAGYYEGVYSADLSRFTLKLIKDKWVITTRKGIWMS